MNNRIEQLIQDVERVAEPVLDALGFVLIDVEYRRERQGWTLRLFVDKEGGITLDECAEVSGHVGDLLEAKIEFEGPYHLEVSSPGLDRPLKRRKHFVHFRGRKAKIKTNEPVDGKRILNGVIDGYSDGEVGLVIEGRLLRIPFDNIVKARLEF